MSKEFPFSIIKYAKWCQRFMELADQYHSKCCDYPCFTHSDLLNFVVLHLAGVKIARQRGSTEETLFGDFGNICYDHLLWSARRALERLREEAVF